MAIISEMQEEKPSLPFKASFDPSNPLGFLEKVLDFIGKESNFLMKDTAEKEISTAVKAAKERLSQAEKKKKAERESLKPVEKKPKKESVPPVEPMEVDKPKEEEKKEAGPIGKSFVFPFLNMEIGMSLV